MIGTGLALKSRIARSAVTVVAMDGIHDMGGMDGLGEVSREM